MSYKIEFELWYLSGLMPSIIPRRAWPNIVIKRGTKIAEEEERISFGLGKIKVTLFHSTREPLLLDFQNPKEVFSFSLSWNTPKYITPCT